MVGDGLDDVWAMAGVGWGQLTEKKGGEKKERMQLQRPCPHANVNPEGEREGPLGRGGTRATRLSGRSGGFEGTSVGGSGPGAYSLQLRVNGWTVINWALGPKPAHCLLASQGAGHPLQGLTTAQGHLASGYCVKTRQWEPRVLLSGHSVWQTP